jgi:hypothetical protein
VIATKKQIKIFLFPVIVGTTLLLALCYVIFFKYNVSVIPQQPELLTYVNESPDYSFQYTPSEVMDHGNLAANENRDLVLLQITHSTPPVARNFKNHEEMIDEIFRYWSSSTSQYPYPELHTISGPFVVEVKTRSGVPKNMYRYEIAWQNVSVNSGVDVWLFIHDEGNEFLWLKYDKQYESPLFQTLQSFTVKE